MNRSTLPLLLLLTALFITDRAQAAPEQKTRFAGVYEVTEDTPVYRRPSENAEQIASIPAGTRVDVFNDRGDWVAIFSRHGRPPGYIKKSSIVKSESSFSRKADLPNATSSSGASPNNGQGLSKVNRSIGSYEVIEDTTVYSSPSENSRQVASISSRTMVDVVLFLSKWVKIQSRQGRPSGYIKRSSLAITEPSSSESAATATEFPRNPQDSSFRSKVSLIKTEIEFNNRLPTVVAIYWVDYQGNEIFYNDLNPGYFKVIQTFATHPWRVRDRRTGQLLKTVVAGSSREVVAIDQSTQEMQPPGTPTPANEFPTNPQATDTEEKQPGSVADVRFALFRYDPRDGTTRVEESPCGDTFTINVTGQVPSNVDLSNDDLAKSILEKAKEHALMRCPKGKAYINVYLYQSPFDIQNWRKDWVVYGNYPSVFKFSLYKPEYVNKARTKRLEEERITDAEKDRVYIQQLKQSLPWHGPRFFFGIYENNPVYEASFKKTHEGCFKPNAWTSMQFCDPVGTVIRFHVVKEGSREPEVAAVLESERGNRLEWFRVSQFRKYGEVSFKEVGKEKTLSPEAHKAIKNLQLLLALVLAGIVALFIAASRSGGSSSAGAGVSSGGGGPGSGTWVGSGTPGKVGEWTTIKHVQKDTGLGADGGCVIKWDSIFASHEAKGKIIETDNQGKITSFQMGERTFEHHWWSGWKEKE